MAKVDIVSRYTHNGWNWVPAPVSQRAPVYGYNLKLEEFLTLLNFPQLWIYAAGTKNPITIKNIRKYYPEYEGGSSGGSSGGGGTDVTRSEVVDIVESILDQRLVVDDKLSKTSKNPVQNKVVTEAIEGIQSQLDSVDDKIDEKIEAYDETVDGKIEDKIDEKLAGIKLDSIQEVEFSTRDAFPKTGEVDKIYIDKNDKKSYLWDADKREYLLIDPYGLTQEGAAIQGKL